MEILSVQQVLGGVGKAVGDGLLVTRVNTKIFINISNNLMIIKIIKHILSCGCVIVSQIISGGEESIGNQSVGQNSLVNGLMESQSSPVVVIALSWSKLKKLNNKFWFQKLTYYE